MAAIEQIEKVFDVARDAIQENGTAEVIKTIQNFIDNLGIVVYRRLDSLNWAFINPLTNEEIIYTSTGYWGCHLMIGHGHPDIIKWMQKLKGKPICTADNQQEVMLKAREHLALLQYVILDKDNIIG